MSENNCHGTVSNMVHKKVHVRMQTMLKSIKTSDSKLRKWLYNIQKNKKQPPYYQLSTIWNEISIEKQLSWI